MVGEESEADLLTSLSQSFHKGVESNEKGLLMEILPNALIECLAAFRPLLRHEVFLTFTYLMTGLLAGEAKAGVVRASVFAPADYQPARTSDFFTTHRVSPQRLMAALVGLVLRLVYAEKLPGHLFWIGDSTLTEKPYAAQISGVRWFHRAKRVAGRGKSLKGHCFACAALLYEYTDDDGQVQWASTLVGALLYVKGRALPLLLGELAGQLRLPLGLRHVWVVDRGLLARTLMRAVAALGQFALGRVRANQIVYFAPRRQPKKGRKKTYGAKCRVDRLLKEYAQRLRLTAGQLQVHGQARTVKIYDAEILLRGVWAGRAGAARVVIVVVPSLPKLKPWYLLTTDLTLTPTRVMQVYAGRQQIEVNFDEVKELGLGHYQGRSGTGVRRWAVLLCLAQALLKLAATGHLKVGLPSLNWSWYKKENTVGQIRRRLVEHCHPRISRTLPSPATTQESAITNVQPTFSSP